MARNERQLKMIDIVTNNEVETQMQLTEMLINAGFAVSQATICRDMQELGIVKVMTPARKYRYEIQSEDTPAINKFSHLFRGVVTAIKSAGNIIVIRTVVGSANSAAAFIDSLDMPDIIGTLAGDDTVFLVIDNVADVQNVKSKLMQYLD